MLRKSSRRAASAGPLEPVGVFKAAVASQNGTSRARAPVARSQPSSTSSGAPSPYAIATCFRSSPRSTPGWPTPAVFQSIKASPVSPTTTVFPGRHHRERSPSGRPERLPRGLVHRRGGAGRWSASVRADVPERSHRPRSVGAVTEVLAATRGRPHGPGRSRLPRLAGDPAHIRRANRSCPENDSHSPACPRRARRDLLPAVEAPASRAFGDGERGGVRRDHLGVDPTTGRPEDNCER